MNYLKCAVSAVLFFICLQNYAQSLEERLLEQNSEVRKKALEELTLLDIEKRKAVVKHLVPRLVQRSPIGPRVSKALLKLKDLSTPLVLQLIKNPEQYFDRKYNPEKTLYYVFKYLESAGEKIPGSEKLILPYLESRIPWEENCAAIETLVVTAPDNKEVIAKIEKVALETEEQTTAKYACFALSKMSPKSKVLLIRAEKELEKYDPDDSNNFVKINLFLETLSGMGSEALPIVPKLIELFDSDRPATRSHLSKYVANFGSDAVPALQKALKSDDVYVRGTAVRALTLIKPRDEKIKSILMEIFKDKKSLFRGLAGGALSRSEKDNPEYKKALEEFKKDNPYKKLGEKEKNDFKKLWTKEEMLAPIPVFQTKDSIKIKFARRYGKSGNIFITLHTGNYKYGDILSFYAEKDNGYKLLKRLNGAINTDDKRAHQYLTGLPSPGMNCGGSYFNSVVEFQRDVKGLKEEQEFIHVNRVYFGTGHYVQEHVFHIYNDELFDVKFISGTQSYKKNLKDGEYYGGEENGISDNQMWFSFLIWEKNVPKVDPPSSIVNGTYKLELTGRTENGRPKFRIIIDSCKRTNY